MTSATERLRALLDERGVRWTACSKATIDNQTYCYGHTYTEFQSGLMVTDLTPEQAVAATLGETPTPHVEDLGRLHDELRDAIVEILGDRCDWDQNGVRHAHEVLERAATLGPGTCHDVGRYAFVCSECGWASDEPHHILGGFWPKYCPECGRALVE